MLERSNSQSGGLRSIQDFNNSISISHCSTSLSYRFYQRYFTLIQIADMSAGPSITSSDRMKSVDSALSSVISSLEKEQELKKVSLGDESAAACGQLPEILLL